MSASDHLGFDQRARVMVEIKGGAWKLVGGCQKHSAWRNQ